MSGVLPQSDPTPEWGGTAQVITSSLSPHGHAPPHTMGFWLGHSCSGCFRFSPNFGQMVTVLVWLC